MLGERPLLSTSYAERIARLSDELDDTAGLLDLLLSESRDEAGLDDKGLADAALAKELEVAEVDKVDNGDRASGGLNLSLGERDKLQRLVGWGALWHFRPSRLTLSRLIVGR